MKRGEHELTARIPSSRSYQFTVLRTRYLWLALSSERGPGFEEPMAYYRLYLMACRSFRIEHFHDFVADDESAASEIAASIEAFGTRELWSGARLVKRWEQSAPTEIDGIYSCEPDGTGHSTWRDADSSEPSGSSVTMGAK